MRLGLNLRYLGRLAAAPPPEESLAYVQEAERLGYCVVWSAEVFSSDAVSVLAWLAARTERIELGTAAMQIPARTPAMTAMTAASLDLLSGGRFRLGLGVSGPQVSEGWHGVRFERPLVRTREYIAIVRQVLAEQKVVHDGTYYPLPLPGGEGKPLRLGMHPRRKDLPVYLAAVGPANTRLAGEIADGWLSVFFQPEASSDQLTQAQAGRKAQGLTLEGFDVVAAVPVVIGDDTGACADRVRLFTAHYLGGMGSKLHNFYTRQAARTGHADAAQEVQRLYLDGRIRAAAAAVPRRFLEQTCLLGPVSQVADRLRAYQEAGVTTLSAMVFPRDTEDGIRTLRLLADALAKSGAGD
ncbi:LLM class F420-dependent oxidoreductase [Streptomyces sp. RB6PN25]|uniref:LLM class F420-dependent oxidoreductase n=1 Tax=Streptomyces humicola TaxID=2953240 RepID=A0ABT1PTA5_9ACTN|nr:LLM class F420-dependent oxidoreductase [Streptomyces humicola]MCQ4080913.1 LLM class F420-dependent oxidoreductase [Streptomyces humicola]